MSIDHGRCVVLLVCGHWTQTDQPDAGAWTCPEQHGRQPAVTVETGDAIGDVAVLTSWSCYWPDE